MKTPEEYFNDSSFVTSDFLEKEDNTLGLNTNVLFELMQEYAVAQAIEVVKYCKTYPGQTKHLTPEFIIKQSNNQ